MRKSVRTVICFISVFTLAAIGCGKDTTEDNSELPISCTPDLVSCPDEIFQDLDFQTTVAPGLVISTDEGGGVWSAVVDATAGGFMVNPPDAYVYAKFGDSGLEKVSIDDDSAIDSMAWDVAFRRFMIRINSGVSGPSCTVVAPMSASVTFDSVTEEPTNLVADPDLYREDSFYTSTCSLIPDTFGLGSPATAMLGFWTYADCVEMTGRVFILALSSGRHVKLEITSYYNPAAQADCDAGNWPPTGATGSGNIHLEWAFLD